MAQINIRVGDFIDIIGIEKPCKVVEIQTDGVVAETELGREFIPCAKIIGVECND